MNYEIKRMSIGEILDTSFQVFRDNIGPLFGIAAFFQVLNVVLGLLVVMVASGGSELATAMSGLTMLAFLFLLAPFNTAITTRIIADRYLGRPGSIGSAVRASLSLFLPLLGAVILSAIFTSIGFIFLFIPGVYLSLRFSLIAPAAVVEQRGGMHALGRSGMLVKDGYGKIFVLVIINIVAGVLTTLPTLWIFGDSIAGTFTNIIIGGLLASFFAVVWTVTYFERRCEHENFDMQLLAQSFSDSE